MEPASIHRCGDKLVLRLQQAQSPPSSMALTAQDASGAFSDRPGRMVDSIRATRKVRVTEPVNAAPWDPPSTRQALTTPPNNRCTRVHTPKSVRVAGGAGASLLAIEHACIEKNAVAVANRLFDPIGEYLQSGDVNWTTSVGSQRSRILAGKPHARRILRLSTADCPR